MKINIAIFASGSGSNAENIILYFKNTPSINIPVIISNNPAAKIHERAKELGVPSITLSKEQITAGTDIENILKAYNIDFIVLAGFLLKIPDKIIQDYHHKIVNIHPSLLPKFGGKGMFGSRVHEAVINAGETESGITIHYVNDKYDEGEIIFQASCSVDSTDTPLSVAQKVHKLEYKHYPQTIEKLIVTLQKT